MNRRQPVAISFPNDLNVGTLSQMIGFHLHICFEYGAILVKIQKSLNLQKTIFGKDNHFIINMTETSHRRE